ncbi:MAG: peptidase [Candidatus Omnitrophica bacterium]|nr:peptidase [Candidatus Omnitrophota bacterium]
MTYCLAMKLEDGLIGLADTRLTAGNQTLIAKKLLVRQNYRDNAVFFMTSGLRALRDKALIYFQELLDEQDRQFKKMYQLVNAFGAQIRRVADEDRKSLKEAGYDFNIHALIGGQLKDDPDHKVFMVFPEGNWVEVGEANPYFIIGNNSHGKPILDRVMNKRATLEFALKVAFLSFNATRVSSNDVEYPIDVIVYKKDTFMITQQRFEQEDLQKYSDWWQKRLAHAIDDFPSEWATDVLKKFEQEQQQQ